MYKILVLASLLLAGCSSYQTQFDCPAEKGLSCTSLYDVNKLIDKKQLGVVAEETAPAELEIYFPPFINRNGQLTQAKHVPLTNGGHR